jgi:hypothetical protein
MCKIWRIVIQASLGIKGDLIFKIKRARGMAQVIEHLPHKHETFSSSPVLPLKR